MSHLEPWLTLKRTQSQALQTVRESGNQLALARHKGKPMGFILWTTVGMLNGYIRTVAVAPQHQGKGVGQQLIGHAEQAILSQSPNVFLCVSSFNPRAQSLYERLGYVQIGRLENFLIPGHDEYLLRKAGSSWQEFRPRERNAPSSP